uniref:non-specific serine/threonine protein kinase n=1 Tax=Haptolina brevifila TaxID=156173 RepID=A0A7S2GE21_9EUKA|mmetsp:Transcript_34813/g.69396  ORF Transcript_34813/g.69396 Transcript_34813/m.69396 type:complete len:465 (+) Transcript_34813:186-1580(+)
MASKNRSPPATDSRAAQFARLIELKHEHLVRSPRSRTRSTRQGCSSLREQRQHLSPDDFECLGVLGRGAFAEVSLVRKRDTHAVYAMKRMRKSDLIARGYVERAWTEWMVQRELDGNPWLVALHFCFQTQEDVLLVMDYVPGGDLMGLLMRVDILPEKEARFYAAQAVLAIEALHSIGYAHRDIKPDNLLLDLDGHLKLADLGLAKGVASMSRLRISRGEGSSDEGAAAAPSEAELSVTTPARSPPSLPPAVWEPSEAEADEGEEAGGLSVNEYAPETPPVAARPRSRSGSRPEMWSRVGTPDYMAPEVILRNGYGLECDWWSLGVIIYEMLIGYAPFYSEDPQETTQKILHHKSTLEFPQQCAISPAAKDLICSLLRDSEERISVDEIKAHSFFAGLDWAGLREPGAAPHTPTLSSDVDASNFELFEPATQVTMCAMPLRQRGGSRDPEAAFFAGFNYRRPSS